MIRAVKEVALPTPIVQHIAFLKLTNLLILLDNTFIIKNVFLKNLIIWSTMDQMYKML